MEYPVPKTSAIAFQRWQDKNPQNPGLVLERFAPDWRDNASVKKDGLTAVVKAAERADSDLLKAWNARWEAGVRAAGGEPFSLRTDWRLVAGLGRKGSLEVGFTFHRYGFPVLPGSSLKGIARAWALATLAEHLGSGELKTSGEILARDSELEFHASFGKSYPHASDVASVIACQFRYLLGTTGRAGQAIFFDAIPASKPTLELDVMNPHYPDYYREGKGAVPPTDWQSPVPVYFLTVAPGTEFRFAVGWRGVVDDEARGLRDMAREWLVNGLAHLGVGAKTSAGYGYFVLPSSSPPSTATGAAGAQAAVQPAVPAEPVVERRGVIVEIRPDKRRGRVRDVDTDRVYSFSTTIIEGNTPANKAMVVFQLRGDHVVKLWRA